LYAEIVTDIITWNSERKDTIIGQHKQRGSNTDPTKKPMGNAGAREEFALTASDKVTAVLLIYTVKFGKSICSERGKKKMYENNKISIII
jgi:hypothetical protein